MKREEEQYDIFLSYRRKGGFETAKHIFDLLTRDGYRVSFDIDTLRSGDFDTQLLQRIDECTDFIVILNAGAFDRSIDPTFDRNKDWLRIELAYALEKEKNIIPVMLNGFTEFPDNLPDDIAAVERKNGTQYNHYYFDAFYNRLLRFLNSKPITQKKTLTPQVNSDDAILKIETDLACVIYIDGEEQGILQVGEIFRTPLRGGCYRLLFVSTENTDDYIEDRNFHISKDIEEWYSVSLLPLKQKREKEEREQYLRQQPDNFFIIHQEKGKWGFIDKTGNIVIPCIYNKVDDFHDGLAKVRKNGKWGFIDRTGNEIIPCVYDNCSDFKEGLAQIEKEGEYGFIDKAGNVVIPCIYDDVDDFRDGLARVRKDGKYGFIDKVGNEITPCVYDDYYNFKEGLARVQTKGKWGVIDKVGNEITPCIYDDIDDFHEGLARVKKDDKYGFIDKVGNETTPCIYDDVDDFHEGLAIIKKDDKYGFIDKAGIEVIPCIYDRVCYFHEGLARVKKEAKWGVIDKTENGYKLYLSDF